MRTEAEIFDALAKRYAAPEYALIPQATPGTGWRARRWLDAVAVSLWPSRGITFHGFEIKSHRSDWARELRDPEKGEALFSELDFFSVVAGDAKVIPESEVPTQWGLAVVTEKGELRHVKVAPRLHEGALPRTMSRDFLAGVFRRLDERYVTRKIAEGIAAMREVATEEAEARVLRRLTYGREADQLALGAFVEGLGYSGRLDPETAKKFGRIASVVLDLSGKHGSVANVRSVMRQVAASLKAVEKLIEDPGSDSAAVEAAAVGSGVDPLIQDRHRLADEDRKRCDHKFVDSTRCLKCGWEPPALQSAKETP